MSTEKDKYGNIRCLNCKEFYSPVLKKCPKCCPHNELNLEQEYEQCTGYYLSVICTNCGRDYNFKSKWVIDNFKLVRK